jgi:hypothetical protein
MKYLLLLFITTFNFAQASLDIVRDPLIEVIAENFSASNNKLEISYKRSSIPKSVKSHLRKKFHGFSIANPGRNFREGCVVTNPLLSNKQLQFTIKNGPYFGMVFKNGGKALSTYFVFCKKIHGKTCVLGIYDIGGNDLNEYMKNIRNGNITRSYYSDEE